MKGDKSVLEYLNKALRHELTAVNQYWLHYRLLDDWGYSRLGEHHKNDSIDEMKHADQIIARILFLEGHPNLQELNALETGENVKEVLEADLRTEYSARKLYGEARAVCRDANDFTSMGLFEDLIADEEHHIDWLETQLSLYGDIGAENYGQLQAGDGGG